MLYNVVVMIRDLKNGIESFSRKSSHQFSKSFSSQNLNEKSFPAINVNIKNAIHQKSEN
jgi:hypothetical protein